MSLDPEQDWPWLAQVLWGSEVSGRSMHGGFADEPGLLPDIADGLSASLGGEVAQFP